MALPHQPITHGPRRGCSATFRFVIAPRFELVHLAPGLAPRQNRWLRMGTAGGITALLLGLDDRTPANTNTALTAHDTYITKTTAGKRPHILREMELRHDTYGGIFADWPDPGGTEQPV
jgi:hypothetical protein